MFSRTVTALSLLAGAFLLQACGGGGTQGPTPAPTPAPTPNFPVIMAAGDISCDTATPELPCKSKETSDLIIQERALRSAVVVLPLGDLQYDAGTLLEFRRNYHTTWGRVNDISHPVPGNHEYLTRNAEGYFDYFASVNVGTGPRTEGWYTFPVGNWRFFALNSNCGNIGGCGTNSPQYRWLQSELLANRQKCAVAYWHHPFISSGQNGDAPEMRAIIELLYLNNVEIVLAGHDHLYERFGPMTPAQVPDPVKGIRLFTVGTGGRDLYRFIRNPTSAFRSNGDYGVLRIVMKEESFDTAFIKISGESADPSSGVCF
jgi:hypothetical protein